MRNSLCPKLENYGWQIFAELLQLESLVMRKGWGGEPGVANNGKATVI